MEKIELQDFVEALKELEASKPEPQEVTESLDKVVFDKETLSEFRKVAFDIYEKQDGSVWQIQADEDGAEWLVRTEDPPLLKVEDWEVVEEPSSGLTIAYKKVPIQGLSKQALAGVDISDFANWLSKQLRQTQMQKRVIASLSKERRDRFVERFPAYQVQ